MAILLVQSRAQSTSSAAPASLAAAYSSNTTAGNLLVALVSAADSGAPTIATPTSASGTWLPITSLSKDQGTALSLRAWYMPNNPGGFTGVTFPTLTNINGLAVALYEFSGIKAVNPLDLQSGASVTAASGTAIGPASNTPVYGGELWIGFQTTITGVSDTAGNSPSAGLGTWTAGVNPTSTLGATNVQMQDFYSLSAGVQFPSGGTYSQAGTASGSIASGALLVAFLGTTSRALAQVYDGVSGFGLMTDPGLVSVGG